MYLTGTRIDFKSILGFCKMEGSLFSPFSKIRIPDCGEEGKKRTMQN